MKRMKKNNYSKLALTITVMIVLVYGIFEFKKGFKTSHVQMALDGLNQIRIVEQKTYGDQNLSRLYMIEIKSCFLTWEVVGQNNELRLSLDNRSEKCPLNLISQIPFHKKILDKIVRDYPNKNIVSFGFGSLEYLDQTGDTSRNIILSMISNKDYEDYRQNYPEHESKKHINTIFEEHLFEHKILKDLDDVFASVHLKLVLLDVEKVFTLKADKALEQFKVKLPIKHLIYDAGRYSFTVQKIK